MNSFINRFIPFMKNTPEYLTPPIVKLSEGVNNAGKIINVTSIVAQNPDKVSTCPVDLLFPQATPERRAFVIENHEKLIALMGEVDETDHDQNHWAVTHQGASCGTSACALGWAALSQRFKGLQYARVGGHWVPTLNGEVTFPMFNGDELTHVSKAQLRSGLGMEHAASEWGAVGVAYFGESTTREVFYNTSRSKQRVIEKLKDRLEEIKNTSPNCLV